MIEKDGWFPVATRGGHRQFKHPTKPGRVTIADHTSDDLAPGALNSILRQAGLQESRRMRDAIVFEKADRNYSAYVPDLPGCMATGATVPAVEANIVEAIRFHIAGLRQDGLAVSEPTSILDYVEP